MANKKPLNLDALVNAGTHAQTAAKPATVDLSDLYGEHGGKVLDAPTQAKGAKPVDLSNLYGERGGLLQTQTTADEPTKE